MKSQFKVLMACVGILCCLMIDIHAATTTVTYTYDDQDRLTGVDLGGSSAIAYEYDDAGNILSVSNQGPSLPVVTTAGMSNISTNSATSGGEVTSDGDASVTARGVCWSTSQNPTISDSNTNDGSGTGNFTSHLSGLSSGTTYHVRAYATNSVGTNCNI